MSPVTVLCIQHFLFPQGIQDEIQVPVHGPQAATAASHLPLPKPTDGANATSHVPKRINLRTWNSKHWVKHLLLYVKAALPEHLKGIKQFISSSGEKPRGRAAARHNFLVPVRVACHMLNLKKEHSDAKLIFICLFCITCNSGRGYKAAYIQEDHSSSLVCPF